MKSYRAFLKVRFLEEGKILWLIVKGLIILLALLMKAEVTFGLAMLIAGIYFNSYFISSFHVRMGVDTVLNGVGFYRKEKNRIVIIGSFLDNLPFGFFLLIYILRATGNISLLVFVYTFVLYIFANMIGILIGKYSGKSLFGFTILIIVSAFNFMRLLTLEEYFRFFSPIIQIGNMKSFQWWNLLSLLFLAVMFFSIIISKIKLVILSAFAILILVSADIYQSKDVKNVSLTYEECAEAALQKVNGSNEQFGLNGYENICIYKSVYYPWKSTRDKMVIYIEEDTLYMNCFTESLCNMDEDEIISRAVRSLLKPEAGAETVMAHLYIQLLQGNIEAVYGYSNDKQIEESGRIYSPFYGLVSEILIREPEKFGELYDFFKDYDTSLESIEAWEERNE